MPCIFVTIRNFCVPRQVCEHAHTFRIDSGQHIMQSEFCVLFRLFLIIFSVTSVLNCVILTGMYLVNNTLVRNVRKMKNQLLFSPSLSALPYSAYMYPLKLSNESLLRSASECQLCIEHAAAHIAKLNLCCTFSYLLFMWF